MKSTVKTLFLLSFMLASWSAHAQIYLCKDASGKTISSDRPIPECADRAVREYGKSGALKREIPAPLTAEEKRQKQLQEEKRKAEALAAEEQRKSDRVIMARYTREADIEKARQRSVDVVQEQVKRGGMSVASSEKQLKQAQAEMESYQKKHAKPPAELQHRLQQAEQRVKDETNAMKENEAEIAQINAKFDQALKRYREITAGTATK